jgi:acyl carrier protein
MLAQLIKIYMIDHANVDPAAFEKPDLKVSDLGMDSLGLVEMLFEIEDRFGFQISDPMRFQSMNFNDMVAEIEAQVREHCNGEIPDIDAIDSTTGVK